MAIITRTFTFDLSAVTPDAKSSNLQQVEVFFHLSSDGTYHVNLGKMLDDIHWSDSLPEDCDDLLQDFKTPLTRITDYLTRSGHLDPVLAEEAKVLTAKTGWIWVPGTVAVIWLSASPIHSGPARFWEPAEWLEDVLESITTV